MRIMKVQWLVLHKSVPTIIPHAWEVECRENDFKKLMDIIQNKPWFQKLHFIIKP